MTAPLIHMPEMCPRHQALLVHQVGIGPDGPWRSLIVVAQVVLFQGATCDDTLYARIGGDISRIAEIGCLACFKPDRFGEIVEAAKSGKTGALKALGDQWVAEAAARNQESR